MSKGTAILIRKNITHQHEVIHTIMDSTIISIKFGSEILRISLVYKSPGVRITQSDLDLFTNHNGSFIVAGDLNAKHWFWHSNSTNQASKIFFHHMETSKTQSVDATDSPTHYPYNMAHSSDILDIALLNLLRRVFAFINHNELTSDHNPILISIYDSSIPSIPPLPKQRVN